MSTSAPPTHAPRRQPTLARSPVTPTVPLARDANKRVARPASHVPGLR